MSVLSDSEYLLNYVRNSFIYGDDTGICELIIEKDFPSKFSIQDVLNGEFNYKITDTSSPHFRSSSPEIPLTSNTAVARKLSSETVIKEVELKDASIPADHRYINFSEWPRVLSENDINDLFGVSNVPKQVKSQTSVLSKLLESTSKEEIVSVNIFSNYARFSALRYTKGKNPNNNEIITNQLFVGENDSNKPMREFRIYFWDYEEQRNRSNPIIVLPVLETKVSDLIGLACWKYVEENRSPPLNNASIVSKLKLYMFEDIEDLDLGFGSLNSSDPIYKYQFSHLAILECQRDGRSKFVSVSSMISDSSFVTQSHMEKMGLRQKSITETDSFTDRRSLSNSSDITDGSILVQILLAHGVSKFRFPPETSVGQIIQHTVNKRHLQQHGENYRYKLELESEPNKELDIDTNLSQFENFSFVLVRDMSRRKPAIPDLINEECSLSLSKMMECLDKKTYNVFLKKPLKQWESLLTISQDSIEIDSQAPKLPFRFKPKIIRIPILFLADCVINYHDLNLQDLNKVTIKFVHLKSKSPLAKSLKSSFGNEYSFFDSETNSIKSQNRSQVDVSYQAQESLLNNLPSELTSHSISCQSTSGKLIFEQTMSIVNFKNHFIRKKYLTLVNNRDSNAVISGNKL